MSEQYKNAMRKFIDGGFNKKDLSALDAYFSRKLKDHALPPGLPEGLEGRRMFYSAFLAAFPDIHVHIDDVVSEGDKLVTRWSGHGTHTGELMGIPATGREVTMSGIAIDRFENGQSVEHWEILDQLGLMQQLGVIPT